MCKSECYFHVYAGIIHVCKSECVCMQDVHVYPSNWELSDMGVGTQTWVLWKVKQVLSATEASVQPTLCCFSLVIQLLIFKYGITICNAEDWTQSVCMLAPSYWTVPQVFYFLD